MDYFDWVDYNGVAFQADFTVGNIYIFLPVFRKARPSFFRILHGEGRPCPLPSKILVKIREAIILNISMKGGDYSSEAINRGTAIIRENTVPFTDKRYPFHIPRLKPYIPAPGIKHKPKRLWNMARKMCQLEVTCNVRNT